jgi:hypothetical protein
MSCVNLERGHARDNRFLYGRKNEEYLADFCLVSRRALDDFEYAIFLRYYLENADWRSCCSRLNIDRGAFFHAVYRIEQKLGRIFRETQPYGLFPLDEYFGGTVVRDRPIIGNPTDSLPAEKVLLSCT